MTKATVDGWDCSFDRNWQEYRSLPVTNTMTVSELLRRFCRYFEYILDYSGDEVNPRLGTIQPRFVHEFKGFEKRLNLLKDQMCVMDPFVRDQNVTGRLNNEAVDRIRTVFRLASDELDRGKISSTFGWSG